MWLAGNRISEVRTPTHARCRQCLKVDHELCAEGKLTVCAGSLAGGSTLIRRCAGGPGGGAAPGGAAVYTCLLGGKWTPHDRNTQTSPHPSTRAHLTPPTTMSHLQLGALAPSQGLSLSQTVLLHRLAPVTFRGGLSPEPRPWEQLVCGRAAAPARMLDCRRPRCNLLAIRAASVS